MTEEARAIAENNVKMTIYVRDTRVRYVVWAKYAGKWIKTRQIIRHYPECKDRETVVAEIKRFMDNDKSSKVNWKIIWGDLNNDE